MHADSPELQSMPAHAPRPRRPFWVAVSVTAWLAAVMSGTWALAAFSFAPGVEPPLASTWPSTAPVALSRDRPTLILFAHARCSCTRATLSELDILMASRPRVSAHVLVYRPSVHGADWADSALHARAAAIPGVTVGWDEDGAAATLFGVTTSGHALLYDVAGHPLFSGGITASRGHSGDNAGRSALADLLDARAADRSTTPVFGCSLLATGGDPP